jgi:putative ABC transport system substrate-binding protein
MKIKISFILCIIFFLSGAACSAAASPTVVIVKSKDIAPYQAVSDQFTRTLKATNRSAVIRTYALNEENLINKIRSDNPDLILTLGTSATKLVAEKVGDIPLLFSMVMDPEGSGLKAANMTGTSLDIPAGTQLGKLKEVVPKARRIGVIYNPGENSALIQRAKRAAADMGITLVTYPVRSAKEIKNIAEMRIDALWLVPDSIVCQPVIVKQILYSGLKAKIPVMGISSHYVSAGALLALSCDYEDIAKQAGEIATRILYGKDPGTIPVGSPRKTKLYLNQVVADKIGIRIPEAILNDAEKVFGR